MISVDWPAAIINVPKADLTPLGGEVYDYDLNVFRLQLLAAESSSDGIVFEPTHNHIQPVTIAGITLARVIEIINGYTVTFEDGQYAVNLPGANSNVADVTNVNQVSVRPQNSAGLISAGIGRADQFDGISFEDAMADLIAMARGNIVNQGGNVFAIMAQDGVTPRYVFQKTPTGRVEQ